MPGNLSTSESSGFGTLSELLKFHIDEGNVTPKQIKIAARVSESRAWRWINGKYEPNYSQRLMLLERLPRVVASAIKAMDPALDDEPVPHCSLVELVDQIARGNGERQQQLVSDIIQAAKDQRLDATERARLLAGLNEAMREINKSKAMLAKTKGR